MGLGAIMSMWQRQTKDFAHKEKEHYRSLVIDNRGIGRSDKPFLRYTTSEMARDVIDLLDQLEWTEQRQLHVIGVSMGGMIAQELVGGFLCCKGLPHHYLSLTLTGSIDTGEDQIFDFAVHSSASREYYRTGPCHESE